MDNIITTDINPSKATKNNKSNKEKEKKEETSKEETSKNTAKENISKTYIDDILGTNVVNAKSATENTNNTTSNINYIDHILNNGIVKFDNKNQTSMFFICYKTLNLFCNDMKVKYNCKIPQDFIDKHIIESIPSIIKEYTGNLKKRCKKVVSSDLICLGRKLDNKQCTRKKHNGSEFCKSHLIKLSNGRIDQANNVVIRNKRGRKRKVEFDPRQYDNEYITLWEDIINGEKVLLDNNNNIYTFDLENPQYLGKKTIDTKLDLKKILKDIEDKKTQKTDINDVNDVNINDVVFDNKHTQTSIILENITLVPETTISIEPIISLEPTIISNKKIEISNTLPIKANKKSKNIINSNSNSKSKVKL